MGEKYFTFVIFVDLVDPLHGPFMGPWTYAIKNFVLKNTLVLTFFVSGLLQLRSNYMELFCT